MSTPHKAGLALSLVLAVVLGGCRERTEAHAESGHGHGAEAGHGRDHADHADHAGHAGHAESGHEGEGEATARFHPGEGLEFAPEVLAALDVRTAKAERRVWKRTRALVGQVVSVGGPTARARAVVGVPSAEAQAFKPGQFASVHLGAGSAEQAGRAVLLEISSAGQRATGLTELIFEVESGAVVPAPGAALGLTVELGDDAQVLTVPRSAVLDGAAGLFAYVVNGEAYQRRAVGVGDVSEEHAEITAGLEEGDSVVTSPVHQLWLCELRLTKGGGHSH